MTGIQRLGPTLVGIAALVVVSVPLPGEMETRELPKGAHALATTVAGTGFEDLEPLGPLLGPARIVGIGEATHGTSQFVTMRWRIVEYLARHHGLRLFLMEEDLIAAERLDAFVVDGVGDPVELSTQLEGWGQEWGKSVQERVELLLRAREFNRGREDPIRFAGIDAKRLARAMDAAVEALGALAPELATDVAERYAGFRHLDETNLARRPANASTAIGIRGELPAPVELSGWIRTEGVERGWAGLVLRIEGEEETFAVETMSEEAPSGTTPWTRYEVSARAPEGTTRIVVGSYSVGTGTAWFDGLRLTLDGEVLEPGKGGPRFDFLDDLRQYAPSHDVELDEPREAGEGRSLRLRYRSGEIDAALREARAVVDEVGDLEPATADLDRHRLAIQYARMVVQALEFRDLHAARDRAMADNVAWHLDRFPQGTKAVLAAHDSHVARQGSRLGKLGDHLAARYGDEYLPIAMTTHSGTYLAEGEDGPGIHRLPPAPEGSVESVLHELGLPIVLVDLRRLDRTSGIGRLVQGPIALRGIGLTHREEQFHPVDLDERYDALLFVDATSHTRLLPGDGHREE